jgi:hypothetical protein
MTHTLTSAAIQPRAIYDDDLIESAPRVRYQTLQRLEMIWEACQPHITGDGGKPDPRFIEAGIRCLDRQMKLYRLDQPAAAGNTAATPTQDAVREALRAQVGELEARIRVTE